MAGEAERELVKLALLAFAFELPLYLLLKNLLKRQRPVGLPVFITPSDRYSLPSGHTAAAFLMATVLAASFPLWAPCCLSGPRWWGRPVCCSGCTI